MVLMLMEAASTGPLYHPGAGSYTSDRGALRRLTAARAPILRPRAALRRRRP
jgi:hypothetical protein